MRKAGGGSGSGLGETRQELKDVPLTSMLRTCQWPLGEVKELGISSFDSQPCLIQRESHGVCWRWDRRI